MSATILSGMPRMILLGGATAVLVATTALTLKITQPKLTKIPLPRAAIAAPAQPLDPAILHGALQRSRDEMALP
jgi:hypothetical protein